MQPRFTVGTKFLSHGKQPNTCTVIDIHTTTNIAGEVVGITYLCEHEFAGQTIKHNEVDTTIARGLCRLSGKNSVEEAITIKAYPNVYFGMWDALKATCPLDAFPEAVQAYLQDMAKEGLVKIDGPYVMRLLQPRNSDFAQQLKMFLAKEAA